MDVAKQLNLDKRCFLIRRSTYLMVMCLSVLDGVALPLKDEVHSLGLTLHIALYLDMQMATMALEHLLSSAATPVEPISDSAGPGYGHAYLSHHTFGLFHTSFHFSVLNQTHADNAALTYSPPNPE